MEYRLTDLNLSKCKGKVFSTRGNRKLNGEYPVFIGILRYLDDVGKPDGYYLVLADGKGAIGPIEPLDVVSDVTLIPKKDLKPSPKNRSV